MPEDKLSLRDEDRKKLDDIVVKMSEQGASKAEVQAVVDDFKQKYAFSKKKRTSGQAQPVQEEVTESVSISEGGDSSLGQPTESDTTPIADFTPQDGLEQDFPYDPSLKIEFEIEPNQVEESETVKAIKDLEVQNTDDKGNINYQNVLQEVQATEQNLVEDMSQYRSAQQQKTQEYKALKSQYDDILSERRVLQSKAAINAEKDFQGYESILEEYSNAKFATQKMMSEGVKSYEDFASKEVAKKLEGVDLKEYRDKTAEGFTTYNPETVDKKAEEISAELGGGRRTKKLVRSKLKQAVVSDFYAEKTKEVVKPKLENFKKELAGKVLNEFEQASEKRVEYENKSEELAEEILAAKSANIKSVDSSYKEKVKGLSVEAEKVLQPQRTQLESMASEINELGAMLKVQKESANTPEALQAYNQQAEAYNQKLEQYNALNQAYEKQVEEVNRQLQDEYADVYNEYVNQTNSVSEKLKSAYERRQRMLADEYNTMIREEYQKFVDRRDLTDEEKAELNKIYKEASDQVFDKELQAKTFIDENTSKGFNWLRDYWTSLGRAIAASSETLGIDQGVVMGEEMETAFATAPKPMKDWEDLLDVDKMLQSSANLAGSMTTSMGGTALVSMSTAGLGTIPALVAGGLTGWTIETVDMTGQSYRDKLDQTGSVAEAEKASKEMFKGQVENMAFYSLDALPFVDDALRGMRTLPRILAGGGVETATEFAQERRQSAQEQAIRETGQVEGWKEFMTPESDKETFLNIIPTFFMGGAGQVRGSMSDSKIRQRAKEAGMMISLNEVNPDVINQYIMRTYQEQGEMFTKAMIAGLGMNGSISKEEILKYNQMLETVKKVEDRTRPMGLNNENQLVYLSMLNNYNNLQSQAEQSQDDPVAKGIYEERAKEAMKNAREFAINPTEGGSFVQVQVEGKNPYTLTESQFMEFMDSKENRDALKAGDINFYARNVDNNAIQAKLEQEDTLEETTVTQPTEERVVAEGEAALSELESVTQKTQTDEKVKQEELQQQEQQEDSEEGLQQQEEVETEINEETGQQPSPTEVTVPEGAQTEEGEVATVQESMVEGQEGVSPQPTAKEAATEEAGVTEEKQVATDTEGDTRPQSVQVAESLGRTEDISDVMEGATKTRVGSTDLILTDSGTGITLESIETVEGQKGKGGARRAMDKLVNEADKRGIPIRLKIQPKDRKTNKKRLKEFYEGMGFEVSGDVAVRQPQKVYETKDGKTTIRSGENRAEVTNTQSEKKVPRKEAIEADQETQELAESISETRTATLKVAEISQDPKRFQYKSDVDPKTGVSEKLKGRKFDQQNAGVISVWKDPKDGKTYVVNGHHRLDLAKANNVENINVQYISAKTAEEARTRGAIQNIAEGQGTAIDSAKVFRSEGFNLDDLSDMGLGMTDAMTRKGLALAQLSQPLFDLVTQGKISESVGAIIGEIIPNQDIQEQFYNTIKGRKLSNATIKVMAEDIQSSPKETEQVTDLFGTTEKEQAQYEDRAKFIASVGNIISRAKNFLKKTAKGKDFLEEFGNRINQERSEGASEEAAAAQAVFQQLRNTNPEIKALIDQGIERINNGENRRTVQNETAKQIIEIAEQVLQGKTRSVQRGKGTSDSGNKVQAEKQKARVEPGEELSSILDEDFGSEDYNKESVSEDYVNRVTELMKPMFPSVMVFNSKAVFQERLKIEGYPKDFAAKGFVGTDGNVYLNPELMTYDTPVHEFGHIWLGLLRVNNPEMYQIGVNLVQGSKYLENALNAGYANGDVATEEALAQAIGEKGAEVLNQSAFKTWLQDMYDYIKNMLNIETNGSIEDMTLEEFANMAIVDMVKANGELSKVTVRGVEKIKVDMPKFQTDPRTSKAKSAINKTIDRGIQRETAVNAIAQRSGLSVEQVSTLYDEVLVERESRLEQAPDEPIFKESSYYTAVKESPNTTTEELEYLMKIEAKYQVGSNKWAANEVQRILSIYDKANAVDDLYEMMKNPSTKVHETVRAMMLIEIAAYYGRNNNQMKRAEVNAFIAEKGTKGGQFSQALSQGTTPNAIIRKFMQGITDEQQKAKSNPEFKKKFTDLWEKFTDMKNKMSNILQENQDLRAFSDSLQKKVKALSDKIEKLQNKKPTIVETKEGKKRMKVDTKSYNEGVKQIERAKKRASRNLQGIQFQIDESERKKIVADLADGYIKQGYFNMNEILDLVANDLTEATGTTVTQDRVRELMGNLEYRIRNAVTKQLQRANKDFSKIVKEVIRSHYSSALNTREEVIQNLIDQAGLNEKEAQELHDVAFEAFNEIVRQNTGITPKDRTLIGQLKNGKLDQSQFLEKMLKQNGVTSLTERETEVLYGMVDSLERYGHSPREMQRVLADFNAFLDDLKDVSKVRKIVQLMGDVFYANILSGVTTLARGGKGVTMTMVAEVVVESFKNPRISFATTKGLSAIIRGFKKGYPEVKRYMQNGVNTLDNFDERTNKTRRLDVIVNSRLKDLSFGNQIVKLYEYVPVKMVRALVALDAMAHYGAQEYFELIANYNNVLAETSSSAERKFGEVMAKLTERMNTEKGQMEVAMKQAQEEYNVLIKNEYFKPDKGYVKRRAVEIVDESRDVLARDWAERRAREGRLGHHPIGFMGALYDVAVKAQRRVPFVERLIPFLRIPTNAVNMWMDWSPWGFVRAGFIAKTGLTMMDNIQERVRPEMSVDSLKRDKGDAINMAIKAIVGTGVWTLLYSAIPDGEDDDEGIIEVTADGYGTWTKNQSLIKGGDWRYHSFRIKNPVTGEWSDWYDYRDSPIGATMVSIGSISDEIKYKGEGVDKSEAISTGFVSSMLFIKEQNYMQALIDLANLFSASAYSKDKEGAVQQQGAQFVSKFVGMQTKAQFYPNIYKQFYQTGKSAFGVKEKFPQWSRRDFGQSLMENTIKDVPYLENYIENDKVDALGFPVVRPLKYAPVYTSFVPDDYTDWMAESLRSNETNMMQKYTNEVWQLVMEKEAQVEYPRRYRYRGNVLTDDDKEVFQSKVLMRYNSWIISNYKGMVELSKKDFQDKLDRELKNIERDVLREMFP